MAVLTPTPFSFYLDSTLQSAIEDFEENSKGVQVAYLLNARLVGNRKLITHEDNITDLE